MFVNTKRNKDVLFRTNVYKTSRNFLYAHDFFFTPGLNPGGGGVLRYMGYIGMCRCEGYGFQAVYSRIGYINQSVWL